MTNETTDADLKTWVRSQVNRAVKAFEELQVFDDAFIESKPAWAFPSQVVIGKARPLTSPQSVRWFVCGEVRFDHVDGIVAVDPRAALRHFAMKWQIEAERATDEELRDKLVSDAEFLYQLSDDDRLWSSQ